MQEQLRERLRLEDDLNQALVREEFFLEFQPIIDLKTTELLGVEALVRWQHPEQGGSCLAQFIPMAEETGQIIALGRWVLMDACCRVQEWRKSVAAGDGLRIAVNISGRHLQQGDLVGDVRHALEVSGLEPESLLIELTESTMMHNSEANLLKLRELKALGVRLAIDDFGTGYSSLSYLHRFPIDILKIDRSFVSRLTESSEGPKLARAVVMLGETLGLETVAEGVEVDDQVTQLLQLGCVAAQGFLFSHATITRRGRGVELRAQAASSCAPRTTGYDQPDGDRPLPHRRHRAKRGAAQKESTWPRSAKLKRQTLTGGAASRDRLGPASRAAGSPCASELERQALARV